MRLDWNAVVDSPSFRNICQDDAIANDKATTCASRARRRMAWNGWQAASNIVHPERNLHTSETFLSAWTKDHVQLGFPRELRYVFINGTHPEYRRRTEHAEFVMPVSDVFRARIAAMNYSLAFVLSTLKYHRGPILCGTANADLFLCIKWEYHVCYAVDIACMCALDNKAWTLKICNYKNCTGAVILLKINESRKHFILIRMYIETLRKDVTGMWSYFYVYIYYIIYLQYVSYHMYMCIPVYTISRYV